MTKKQIIEKIDDLIKEYEESHQVYNNLQSSYYCEEDYKTSSNYEGRMDEINSFIKKLENLKKE